MAITTTFDSLAVRHQRDKWVVVAFGHVLAYCDTEMEAVGFAKAVEEAADGAAAFAAEADDQEDYTLTNPDRERFGGLG